MNVETRSCQNCNNNFTIEPEDFKFYDKISVPPPTWRLNEFETTYAPERPEIIYCEQCYLREVV
ncbi:MAG TPA: hypothetical protein VJL09_02170 [Candidatus Paceibacterota bacterium]